MRSLIVRQRIDAELVRRRLARSREHAHELIAARRVLVQGAFVDKPARLVSPGAAVEVTGAGARFVSRGGDKLDAALDRFGVAVAGRRAVDVGASTGGFTDCLLQRGAAEVVALDVGHGQLHPRLRADPRVRVFERVNVRHVEPGRVGAPVPLVVCDVSFISARRLLAQLCALVDADGDLVVLVKPQFEAGRAAVSKAAGVVRDPEIWNGVLSDFVATACTVGATPIALMSSPIKGGSGNVEFFAHLRRASEPPHAPWPELISAAIAEGRRL